MANPEHLRVVKQGTDSLKTWQATHVPNGYYRLDLADADLRTADLNGADLRNADMRGCNLRGANMIGANLQHSSLIRAALTRVDFSNARLENASLSGSDLTEARLESANLTHADLRETNLSGAVLGGAHIAHAVFFATVLGAIDLATVTGLDTVLHEGPSIISVETLRKSKGRLPAIFLRGCGLSDWEIKMARLFDADLTATDVVEYLTELSGLRTPAPIQISPIFISYSHRDSIFIDSLEHHLDRRGIRFWRDVHDLTAGRIQTQLERAISLNPTVLLVLSRASVESDWVEWEAAKARELEKLLLRDVLCPIALDDTWKTCSWPGALRRQIEDYHVIDFSRWQDIGFFNNQFRRLIDGLKLFYESTA